MELYLIRHGEAEDDVNDTIGGEADDPLTDRGREQARGLASRLAGVSFSSIYASPLARAWETAEIVARSQGVCVVQVVGLSEMRRGVLAGLSRAEALRRSPGGVAEGAETAEQFRTRVEACWTGLLRVDPMLIVAHGGTINALLHHLLGLTIDFPAFSLGQASLSHLTLTATKTTVHYINYHEI